jgi:hypothetical protein
VLPSAHILPFGTSVRSTVHGPPATRVICSSNPVDDEIVPPQVTSGLHCVVMDHVFVVGPLMKVYAPSRRSSAHAGLANAVAAPVIATATAIARKIATILSSVCRPARV